MKTIPLATTLAFLAFLSPLAHAQEAYAGKMSATEFMKVNAAAGEKIKAIKPSSTALSEADQSLLNEIVKGGTKQLVASEAAVAMATSSDVKVIAQAEVEEQKGLAAKLKEIAEAKKATLPEDAADKAEADLKGLKEKKGDDFDKEYLRITGVEGHEALNKVMTKVEKEAKDENLKEIAKIALPLIKVHLNAAREEAAKSK